MWIKKYIIKKNNNKKKIKKKKKMTTFLTLHFREWFRVSAKRPVELSAMRSAPRPSQEAAQREGCGWP